MVYLTNIVERGVYMIKTKVDIQENLTEEERIELEEKRKAAHREAQKRYREKKGQKLEENYKIRSIRFKQDEDEKINEYCKANNIQRNALILKATMEYIEKFI